MKVELGERAGKTEASRVHKSMLILELLLDWARVGHGCSETSLSLCRVPQL